MATAAYLKLPFFIVALLGPAVAQEHAAAAKTPAGESDIMAVLAEQKAQGERLEHLLEDSMARIHNLEEELKESRHPVAVPASKQRARKLSSLVQGRRRLDTFDASAIDASVDTTWILTAGLICFFLQAGFGMLEAGAIREKNAKNIMLKNLMDACIGGLVYYLFGWSLAYGVPDKGVNDFCGWGSLVLAPAKEQDYLGWFFQYVFAATIATIVSGAVAERIQFKAYMIYSAVLTGVIYPIASHWIWSTDGFLNKAGVIDYAGGGAVHALSGVAAFIAALALGPRKGRFVDGKSVTIPPHDTSMMALGAFILWFGFIPFNAGSGLSVAGAMAAQTSRIAVITTLGGCSGACTSLVLGFIRHKQVLIEYPINGVLAGMVAVCSCCAVVRVWVVVFIVSPIAALVFWGLQKVEEKIKVDDPLGASSLHFGPGMVGLIAVGFLADPDYVKEAYGCEFEYREGSTCKDFTGIFYGGSGEQLGWQLLAGLCWTVWGLATCSVLFFGMKFAKILRVSEEDELAGLDMTHHGGPAYISPKKGYIEDKVTASSV